MVSLMIDKEAPVSSSILRSVSYIWTVTTIGLMLEGNVNTR